MPETPADTWYAVVERSTGQAVSFGTVLAEDLPENLAAIELPHDPSGYAWDTEARALGERLPEAPTPEKPVTREEFDMLLTMVLEG